MLATSFLLLVAVLSGFGWGRASDDASAGFRDSFEGAEPGGIPEGWFVPKASAPGYTVEVSAEKPFEGARCVHSQRDETRAPEGFGNLMRWVDAKPFRGRQVMLRAAVRSEGGARGQLWLRFDGPGQESDLVDNMGDRPVRNPQWKRYTLRGDVPEGADRIALGLIHLGSGEVWLDDVEFSIVGPAGAGIEPPRALDERGLANVTAFARLYGYVRHFHPSDAAAEADWDELAIQGVRAVEPARDATALAEALQTFFDPVAPTLRVFLEGSVVPAAPGLAWPADATGLQLIRWEHRGFGTGNPQSIYSSRRQTQRADGKLSMGWRAPADTIDLELGGGVACRLPTVLFHDGQGTLPRRDIVAVAAAAARDEEPKARATDRATRLGAVVVAWNVFQHFYPYFDVVKTDWSAELPRALHTAAIDDGERAFLDTLRRLVAALHDGHGYVSHPCDRDYATLPCAWAWVDAKLAITAIAPSGGGELRIGDVVRAIDGESVDEAYERVAALISASTPQNTRYRALNDLLRGKPQDRVRLAITRPDGSELEVDVARQPRSEFAVERRPEPIAQLEPGIWYVDLDRTTTAQFEAATSDLAAARGIVFDLRGYPSRLSTAVIAHLVDEPARCAKWNVPLVLEPDRKSMTFAESGWDVQPAEPRFHAKAAFVIDGRAISYAETYMGIIEHYRLATIVGEATAGTNGNVNPFVLPGGYSVSWTGMKVLKHDGTRHHGVGIAPQIPVVRTVDGIAAGRDEFLERAIEAVRP